MDVRFLLDEHVDHSIATALRIRGYDALTLADANLLGADDFHDILPFALVEQRILMTRDAECLARHARGDSHAGIVHWHGKKRNVREAIHYLLQLARIETCESMMDQVRYIKTRYP
jgi:uncharacterized protein with PIN domain